MCIDIDVRYSRYSRTFLTIILMMSIFFGSFFPRGKKNDETSPVFSAGPPKALVVHLEANLTAFKDLSYCCNLATAMFLQGGMYNMYTVYIYIHGLHIWVWLIMYIYIYMYNKYLYMYVCVCFFVCVLLMDIYIYTYICVYYIYIYTQYPPVG